jgi:hypothetical protein
MSTSFLAACEERSRDAAPLEVVPMPRRRSLWQRAIESVTDLAIGSSSHAQPTSSLDAREERRDVAQLEVAVTARRRSLWQGAIALATDMVIGGSMQDAEDWAQQAAHGKAAEVPTNFYELSAMSASGDRLISLERFRGAVCLVINVASF